MRHRGWLLGGVFAAMLAHAPAFAGLSQPWEPQRIRAARLIQLGDCPSALKILQRIQKQYPKADGIEDMKAVCLRSSGASDRAIRSLERLASRVRNKRSQKYLAYQYNIGLAKWDMADYEGAEKHFRLALNGGFNVPSSQHYLGRVEFEKGKLPEAKNRLLASLGSDKALDATAQTYLAEISSKEGNSKETLRHLMSAQSLAEEISGSHPRLSQQLLENTRKALAGYGGSQTFFLAGVFFGYDSNVFLSPSFGGSASGTSGDGSSKTLVSYGAGYQSSPVSRTIFAVSLGGALNYNFNSSTRVGQFWSNGLNGSIERNPNSPLSFGADLGLTNVFRSTQTGATSAIQTYVYGASFAPMVSYQISPLWKIKAEVGAAYDRYQLDSTVSVDQRRSGNRGWVRLSAYTTQASPFWNPNFALRGALRDSVGSEFDGNTLEATLSNRFILTETLQLSFDFVVAQANYPSRVSGKRHDLSGDAGVGATYALGSSVILSGSLRYTDHDSNVETVYKYHRYEVLLGANYFF